MSQIFFLLSYFFLGNIVTWTDNLKVPIVNTSSVLQAFVIINGTVGGSSFDIQSHSSGGFLYEMGHAVFYLQDYSF